MQILPTMVVCRLEVRYLSLFLRQCIPQRQLLPLKSERLFVVGDKSVVEIVMPPFCILKRTEERVHCVVSFLGGKPTRLKPFFRGFQITGQAFYFGSIIGMPFLVETDALAELGLAGHEGGLAQRPKLLGLGQSPVIGSTGAGLAPGEANGAVGCLKDVRLAVALQELGNILQPERMAVVRVRVDAQRRRKDKPASVGEKFHCSRHDRARAQDMLDNLSEEYR